MEASRASDRASMLLEAGLALSSELSLPTVLQRIIELAARITDARYGALGVLGPEGVISEFITTGVTEEERRAIGHIPHGRGILGLLIDEARPLRLREIAEHPRSVGFPENHPPMRSFLGAPVKAHGRVYGNIYLTEKRGAEEFSADDEQDLVVLATQAGVAVENAQLYEEVRRRERWLDAVRATTHAILLGEDVDETLRVIARTARDLVGGDLALIAVPAGSSELVVQVAVGLHADDLMGTAFPLARSISGEVMATGRPLVIADVSKDPRSDQPVVALGEIGPAIFVPLGLRDSPLGTLLVANGLGGRQFGPDDLDVVESFAGPVALALEYTRAQRDLRRLAVMEDRERIAKELHDGVIQSVFAVGMGLQAAATMTGDRRVSERLEGAVAELDRVVRDLRNYIFGLRPGILADRQLDQALRALAEEFAERTGVSTVVQVDEDTAAQLSLRSGDVVQLVREALSNVGRHADAATCRVSLERRDGEAVLEIDDDGRGFDPEAATGRGHGLPNLRERAVSLGGAVEIESAPGQGTIVRARIPV
jgi:signal transduction histidine kinase